MSLAASLLVYRVLDFQGVTSPNHVESPMFKSLASSLAVKLTTSSSARSVSNVTCTSYQLTDLVYIAFIIMTT